MRLTQEEYEQLARLPRAAILARLRDAVTRPPGRPATGRKTWAEYKREQRERQKAGAAA